MNTLNSRFFNAFILLVLALSLISCAAGDSQFTQNDPAGFWFGIWHGTIAFISLVIHLFNEQVTVYEINNAGGWYDFGFLLGVVFVWCSCSRLTSKSAEEKKREKEWEEISVKVENKIMRKLNKWANEEDNATIDNDMDDLGEKVEIKLKRKIREWAEKD